MSNAVGQRRIGPETVLGRAPDSLERRTGSAVVVHGHGDPLVLRGTGIVIWDAFAVRQAVADVAASLADRYDTPRDVVLREMIPMLEDLHRARALRIEPTAP